MLKLLFSAFRRVITAVTNPFRMLIVRIQRMFNINIITAKLVRPLTKKVKELITLRPQTRKDYIVIGRWWVYKKLLLTIVLVLCAGVFIYFTMFAPKLPAAPAAAASVRTNVYYDYNDMDLQDFSGVCNVRAADGTVVYTGDVDKGVCTGTGTLWDRKGRLEYVGEFEQNRFSGSGVYYYPDGKKKYEGEWANNLYQGEGILYAADGTTQVYAGMFANGLFEGEGKLWSEEGSLLYEGGFSRGNYHGTGIAYYDDGTVRYKGEFLNGQPQGRGEFYSRAGKLLYTGDVYAGRINYRALVNYNYAEVLEAFAETPRVFYTDTDSALVFEQAGVVVTVDCRVRVDTWEKPVEQRDNSEFYYLPGEYATQQVSLTSGQAAVGGAGIQSLSLATQGEAGNSRRVPALQQMSWYVAEDNGNTYNPPESSASSSSSSGDSGSGGSSGSGSSGNSGSAGTSGSVSGQTPAASGESNPEVQTNPGSQASPAVPDQSAYPDFVQKDQKLYFEIDQNVWKSEEDLEKDADKIRVKKVTVFSGETPPALNGAVEYKDNAPPGLEDCVAIDFLRQEMPTAFPQILFEADRQNRLFVRLWNINFAEQIQRKVYLLDNLTYRYAYQSAEDELPLYFSVEH